MGETGLQVLATRSTDELVVIPGTGELVALDDPDAVARAHAAVKDFEARLRDARRILEDALVEEARRRGKKTLHLAAGLKAVVGADTETVWDVEQLRAELTEAGLPEERIGELIRETVEYKVNGSVAREVAGANAEYGRIVERAKTRVAKRPSVSVDARPS